jgi:hypothetical protein
MFSNLMRQKIKDKIEMPTYESGACGGREEESTSIK